MATTHLSQESVRQMLGRMLHNCIEASSKKHFPDWDIESFRDLPHLNQLEMVDAAELFANQLAPAYADLLAALEAMVADYEECDQYPTSDKHPLYAARAAISKAKAGA